jgi:hypothetical protein
MVRRDFVKKLLILIFILLSIGLVATCFASGPYLICDPQAGVTSYQFTGAPSWVPATVAAQADGSLHMDISAAPVGATSIGGIAACETDPNWGTVCSVTVPFSFTRPAVPGPPANVKLGIK